MKTQPYPLLLTAFLALTLTASPADADAPQALGKFGVWNAYSVNEGDQRVCYMSIIGHPPKAAAKKTRRGDVTLMITHRPAENNTDVVSYAAGQKFKPASEAIVTIGKKQFNLFTQNDTAWSRDTVTDHALAAALRDGATVTVTGLSASGAKIADTLYLKGAKEAYRAIGKACGLPVEEPKPKPKPAAPAAPKKLPLQTHR
jgi:hypothetical protein